MHTYIHTYIHYITLHYITLHYITLHSAPPVGLWWFRGCVCCISLVCVSSGRSGPHRATASQQAQPRGSWVAPPCGGGLVVACGGRGPPRPPCGPVVVSRLCLLHFACVRKFGALRAPPRNCESTGPGGGTIPCGVGGIGGVMVWWIELVHVSPFLSSPSDPRSSMSQYTGWAAPVVMAGSAATAVLHARHSVMARVRLRSSSMASSGGGGGFD